MNIVPFLYYRVQQKPKGVRTPRKAKLYYQLAVERKAKKKLEVELKKLRKKNTIPYEEFLKEMAVERPVLPPPAAVDSPERPVLPPHAAVDSPERPVLPPPAAVDSPERPVLPPPAAVDSPERPVLPPPAAVDSPERPVLPPPAAVDSPERPVLPPPAAVDSPERPVLPPPAAVDSPERPVLPPPAAVDSPERPVLPPPAAVDSPVRPVLPPPAAVDSPVRPVLPPPAAVDSPERPVLPPPAAVDSPERPVLPPPAAVDSPERPVLPPPAAVDSPERPVLPPPAAVDSPERPVLPPPAAVDSPERPVLPPPAAVDSPERPVLPPPAAVDSPVRPAAPTVTPSPRTIKKLALYDTFMRNIKGMKKSARRQLLTQITTVEEVKQVRGASLLARDLELDRRSLLSPPAKKTKRQETYDEAGVLVLAFLKKAEHSITLPGKKDTVTIKKKKHQKIQLTEFLYVLHKQYNEAARPEHRVGFSYFCGVRRANRYVLPVQCNNTNVCLCMRHQNFALRMKPLHGLGLPALPDMFIRDVTVENFREAATGLPPVVTYLQWRRVEVPYGQGQSTKKPRLVEVTEEAAVFQTNFTRNMAFFSEHVSRMYNQHRAATNLKEGLQQHECCIQMDFAENWMIDYPMEPQSVYFAKEPVTVHPVVLYLVVDGAMTHKSTALVTDDRKHDVSSVMVYLRVINALLTERFPFVNMVHYFTDGPTSQYRNSSVLSLVSKHSQLFGRSATWLYFEAGHGKGACDGVGAAAKRMADNTVKRQIIIHNAAGFVAAGESTPTEIEYIHVPVEDIATARLELPDVVCGRSVKGTMKAHAAVCPAPGKVALRATSCYKECCLLNGQWVLQCGGWKTHTLFEEEPASEPEVEPEVELESEPEPEQEPETASEEEEAAADIAAEPPTEAPTALPKVGEWACCLYDDLWYVGQVLVCNVAEDYIKANFLAPGFHEICNNQMKWPPRTDELDIVSADILATVSAPQLSGRGRREHFALSPSDVKKCIAAYISL